jgi:acyl-CoA thioester hydrolase
MPTRWMDNDVYGHVNNVTYYSFFDTAVARFLLANGVLDLPSSTVVGLVVDTACRYAAPVAFPGRGDLRPALRAARHRLHPVRDRRLPNDEDRAAPRATSSTSTWSARGRTAPCPSPPRCATPRGGF